MAHWGYPGAPLPTLSPAFAGRRPTTGPVALQAVRNSRLWAQSEEASPRASEADVEAGAGRASLGDPAATSEFVKYDRSREFRVYPQSTKLEVPLRLVDQGQFSSPESERGDLVSQRDKLRWPNLGQR